jgi:hypothetical protein
MHIPNTIRTTKIAMSPPEHLVTPIGLGSLPLPLPTDERISATSMITATPSLKLKLVLSFAMIFFSISLLSFFSATSESKGSSAI